MITLTLMLLAFQPQETRATLQSCAQEGDRWVCRYEMPTFEIVAVDPGVADPRVGEAGTPGGAAPAASTVAVPAASGGVTVDAPPSVTVATVADEPGLLNAAEQRLVVRCADAGWMSLCLPGERRQARELKAEADAYQALRTSVVGLLGESRCEDAVKAALDGGSLSLAREARSFCGAEAQTPPA